MSESNVGKQLPIIVGAVIGLAVGALGTFAVLKSDMGGGADPVVAKFQGQSVKASDAFAPIKTRLFDLEEDTYRLKEKAIQDFIEQRVIGDAAKKENLNPDQFIEKNLGEDSGEISDKEIEDFLTSKGLSLKDPKIRKEDVQAYLKFRQRHEKRQAFVDKLMATAKVEILIQPPQSPKIELSTEGYPSWGNPNAPVTIIELSDYQCPFCSRAEEAIKRVKQEYGPDKVRVVFRDMPLPSHNRAEPAANAALCANAQGKFWEYHDILFSNQTKLEDTDFKKYAADLGLDTAKFEECYKTSAHKDLIEKSVAEAQKLGISATPSFVINGSLIQGAQPFERFKEKIDQAARKGR